MGGGINELLGMVTIYIRFIIKKVRVIDIAKCYIDYSFIMLYNYNTNKYEEGII